MKQILIYLGYGVGSFVLLLILSSIISRINRVKRKYSEKYTVLQVRVSKENETGPIVAENIFSTLHGIQSKFSFLDRLRGYSADHVSFEIASIARSIKFYVAFPEKLRNLVEGQIYAQYPDVEIEDTHDYAGSEIVSQSSSSAFGTELKLIDSDVYPIKRYPQFEDKLTRVAVDPLSSITSSLVKFDDIGDQAWVQIVVSPLSDKWRIIFTKCVRILKKGILGNVDAFKKFYSKSFITRKIWPKIVFFPVYFVFWVQGLLITAGMKSDMSSQNMSLNSSEDIEEMTSKSHERESTMDAAMDKVVRLLYNVNIRIVYLPKNKNLQKANVKLREVAGSFMQFNIPSLNGFEIGDFMQGSRVVNAYRKRLINDGFVLNNEELATIWHLPNMSVQTPAIYWVKSKKLEPPIDLPDESLKGDETITVIGKTNFRGAQNLFGIKPVDRRRHIYIIGKTGMGKSTLLENMVYSDIVSGKGVGVIDPHGDLADAVLSFIPPNRTNDVILIDPSDKEYAVAFNMLEDVDTSLNSVVCSGLVGIFKKIYADSWGPRLEHILRNTILSLLEYPGTTMLGITRLLQDDEYRKKVVRKIEDPVVKSFWLDEFNKMQDKFRVEAISPIQNKVGQFLSSPTIRNIVGQPKSTVDLRFAMDKGKIVIINLSKGKIGEDNSALLGSMFITKFQLDAMGRANIPQDERKDFYLYVDEFQNFATESFATILSEARKYKLNLTMANQYIAQMPDEVRDAVFGNVGTTLSFQVGFDDAEYISQQFAEEALPSDLVSLSKYQSYMRLLIDGMPSKTFSFGTLPPPKAEVDPDHVKKIVKVSRERYSEKTSVIQDKIKRWSQNKSNAKDD
ncbi:MAG: type IV secretion system DNA-binding domain-containing protein [bacterium]|nr:type IV secretion system DNA-binding domain-containing protein [bacterium]